MKTIEDYKAMVSKASWKHKDLKFRPLTYKDYQVEMITRMLVEAVKEVLNKV